MLGTETGISGKFACSASLTLILGMLVVAIFSSGCEFLDSGSIQSYLDDVAAIQMESDASLIDLSQYVDSLGGDALQIKEAVTGLKRGLETVNGARQRLEELDVPDEARTLHDDLVRLYATGEEVLEDLIIAGKYQLEMSPIISEYESSSGEFTTALNMATDSEGVLAALRSFQSATLTTLSKAEHLIPPTFEFHSQKRLITNLRVTEEGLAQMIAGIEQNDIDAVNMAAEKIDSISGDSEQIASDLQADRTADVQAFNARIQEMEALMEMIQQSQADLRERYERN